MRVGGKALTVNLNTRISRGTMAARSERLTRSVEMRVEDPGGYVLRFGSEPPAGLPFRDPIA